MQARDQDVPGEMLHEILKEIDLNRNGQVEFDEYLQVIISAFFVTVLICVLLVLGLCIVLIIFLTMIACA